METELNPGSRPRYPVVTASRVTSMTAGLVYDQLFGVDARG